MWLKLVLGAFGAIFLLGAYWLYSSAFGLETAQYRVAVKEEAFEIRDYPELPVATTAMRAGGDDSAFRKLFRFIQGGNDQQEKIAMTTPVFVDREGEQERMSFVVPKEVDQNGSPDPTIEGVEIDRRPAVRVAVYGFSGVANEDLKQRALQKLQDWMAARQIEPDGDPIYAYYDAPFIPGPFRRNEVMLRIR